MKDFNEKALHAAEMFLVRRGYDIIELTRETEGEDAPVDIVAKEDDSIVFVTVKARKASDKGFPESRPNREVLEKFAVKWFTAHPDDCVDCAFRFDAIALIGINADRAMIRHHIHCMGGGDIELPWEE